MYTAGCPRGPGRVPGSSQDAADAFSTLTYKQTLTLQTNHANTNTNISYKPNTHRNSITSFAFCESTACKISRIHFVCRAEGDHGVVVTMLCELSTSRRMITVVMPVMLPVMIVTVRCILVVVALKIYGSRHNNCNSNSNDRGHDSSRNHSIDSHRSHTSRTSNDIDRY